LIPASLLPVRFWPFGVSERRCLHPRLPLWTWVGVILLLPMIFPLEQMMP
ncbi:Protein-export membrane protein SecF, partial [uncultured Leptolyngbya sp.]